MQPTVNNFPKSRIKLDFRLLTNAFSTPAKFGATNTPIVSTREVKASSTIWVLHLTSTKVMGVS